MSTERPEFDHLLHWVPDVDAAVAAYTAAGLPAHSRPTSAGFQNGGWRRDERYVEILRVHDEQEFRNHFFAEAWTGVREQAEVAEQFGGGAIIFAINVFDAAVTSERLRAEGRRVLDVVIKPEDSGMEVGFHEVYTLDGPAWAPFFITYTPARDQLFARIPADVLTPGEFDLTAIVIETPDPDRSATWLADLVRIPAHDNEIALPGGIVRFTPGTADRIVEVALAGPRPADFTIAGLRYHAETRGQH